MKTIAIYHKDCTDGTTAAAIVLRKFPDAEVHPLSHNYESHEIEKIIAGATKGDRIFTIDCVIGAKEFLAAGFPVTSIDHHAGAKNECDALVKSDPKFTYVFDNNKSGASLSWGYFFPDEKVPELVKLVEDMDIWTWKYGDDTKDVNNYMYTYMTNKPHDVLTFLTGDITDIKKNGRIVTQISNIAIEQGIKNADPITFLIGPHKVPLYNITSHRSESGNILSLKQDKAVGLFTVDGKEVKISFRCLEKHIPSALDLATVLGGSGHRNSSAARIKLSDFVKAIIM